MHFIESSAKKFTLAFPDVFYADGILESFLEIITNLIERDELLEESLNVKFVNGRPDQKVITRLNLRDHVCYSPEGLLFREKLKELSQVDAILFIQRAAGSCCVPDTFYDYLALNKRILAVVPNPVAYEEIAKKKSGLYVANFRNRAHVTEMLLKIYENWRQAHKVVYSSAA